MNVAFASRLLAAAAIAVPTLAGCGTSDEGSGDGSRVVASFYPLEYVAGRVAGEHADVEGLTTPGGEPHDLELTVPQTAQVSDAELLVYLAQFQPAVDEAVEQAGADHVVDAAEHADLVTPEQLGNEQVHEDHAGETGDGDVDPHFWTDPTRLSAVAEAVAAELSDLDPAHADAYAANLRSLLADLEALDTEIETGLASCARDTVVVSHDAFGYFGARYGLDMHPINGLSPEAEPSPAHLRELAELIDEEGITTVFAETLASPEMAETLATDLGLDTAVLDPVEGLTDETADEDYLSLMRDNLARIREANDCS